MREVRVMNGKAGKIAGSRLSLSFYPLSLCVVGKKKATTTHGKRKQNTELEREKTKRVKYKKKKKMYE